MGCKICENKIYRMRLCKVCYIADKKQKFHCTYSRCYRPVFALTLCQRHFKMYKSSCLLCSKKIHCRDLCRKHYQDYLDDKISVERPVCKHCNKYVFVDKLCLFHFKQQYDTCMMVGCGKKIHKKGLCCSHYFKHRRASNGYL